MGLYAAAELYYGIVVSATNDEGEPHPWWSEADDEWFDFEAAEAKAAGAIDPWTLVPREVNDGTSKDFTQWKRENPEWEATKEAWYTAKEQASGLVKLEFNHFGHYENPDGPMAVLSPKGIDSFSGDCWSPTEINSFDLTVSDKRISKAEDYLRYLGWDLSMYGSGRWWLVASYG